MTEINEENTFFLFENKLDNMELWLVLLPTISISDRPNLLDIKNSFIIEGYQCPFDEEKITNLLNIYPEDDILEDKIGVGKLPEEGSNAKINLHVDNPTDQLVVINSSDRVDYKTHTRFVFVKKEQELLTVERETSGDTGEDIYGKPIEAAKGNSVDLSFGKNVEFIPEMNTLYAKADGCFMIESNKYYVNEVYIIDKDLDMKIGNIEIDIPIYIQGDVKPGFYVKSSKDIFIDGNVEGSIIRSEGGQVIIKGGILGQNSAIIYGKMGVQAKFAQNVMLSSEQDIIIESSIIQSTICCGQSLNLIGGDHGSIIGGTIRISKLIKSNNIGSASEPRIDIYMGFDFQYEEELHQLDKKIFYYEKVVSELNIELEKCLRKLKLYRSESAEYEVTLKKKSFIENDFSLKKSILDETKLELNTIEEKALLTTESMIEVSNIIYGNTYIHMREEKLNINNEIKKAKILLRPKNKEIEVLLPEHQ